MKFLIVVCVLVCGASANVAPFLTACKASDAACLLASARKAIPFVTAGVPELGLQPLDPMTIDKAGSREAGLELDMRDTTVKGLKNCDVPNFKRNGRRMNLDVKCPNLQLSGDYTLGGKLLILPIEGKGKYKIKIRDILVKIQIETADVEKNGDKFWKVASWKFTTDVQTNVHYAFQNLFNGNQQASDTIHQFANTNWKEIYNEVGTPVTSAIVSRIVKAIEKMFEKVPVKEINIE
ncbi:protein takeout-like [Cydia fagiglandana]|uniref:protein takeout-like n=1 Tax=Cydia fagiglandana TaxID=1458189 RepID=UPI002FEE259A